MELNSRSLNGLWNQANLAFILALPYLVSEGNSCILHESQFPWLENIHGSNSCPSHARCNVVTHARSSSLRPGCEEDTKSGALLMSNKGLDLVFHFCLFLAVWCLRRFCL